MEIHSFASRLVAALMFVCLSSVPVCAGDWHEEFNELCGQVQTADSLGKEELGSLIERADKLLTVIEASDEPRKKVYIFRLKKCRAMFEFSVQLKQ